VIDVIHVFIAGEAARGSQPNGDSVEMDHCKEVERESLSFTYDNNLIEYFDCISTDAN